MSIATEIGELKAAYNKARNDVENLRVRILSSVLTYIRSSVRILSILSKRQKVPSRRSVGSKT